MRGPLKIISGRSHRAFAEEICDHLAVQLTEVELLTFSNENQMVKIKENVRESDVFVVQTSCPPVSDIIMETFLLLDALKHASAERVTGVLPYFPYVRSDKKDQPRISIAARMMADLFEKAGADKFLTMEFHSPQIQGFFKVPVDQLLATEVLVKHFKENYDLSNYVLVAADVGEAKQMGKYANKLDLPMAIIDKRRVGNTEKVVPAHVIGEVEGKDCLIIDDEVASGGTLCAAADFLKERGAQTIRAAITHPVLSGSAIEKINKSKLDELVVTNSIPLGDKANQTDKIQVLTVAPLFAQAINNIHNGNSISVLFKD